MSASMTFPKVSVNPIERAFARSSAAKQNDFRIVQNIKANASKIAEAGMSLLLELKDMSATELKAIWQRKDADEFAKETSEVIAPKLNAEELAELEKDLTSSTRISKFRQT